MSTTNTSILRTHLRDHLPPPEWAIAFEVQAEADDGGLRFADAIAIRTFKRSVEVHGFELKVSRADWLQEARHPDKAMPGRYLCDYWWAVAGAPDIVKPTEGLSIDGVMEVRDGALHVTRHATRWGSGDKVRQQFVDRALMGAFLRRLDPMEPRAYWEGRERQAERKGFAKGRNEAGRLARKRDRTGTVEALEPDGRFCP